MFQKRVGLIVWIRDMKNTRSLERYGLVHYVSKKMNYAVMYVFENNIDGVIQQINKLPFVIKVEYSYRKYIKTEYNKEIPDETKFYSY